MSEQQDRQFFRFFGLTLVGLTLVGIAAAILGRTFAPLAERDGDVNLVAKRIEPIGRLYTAENPPPHVVNTPAGASGGAAASADIGKSTYDTVCAACHGAGVAGAPKLGDKAAWEPRIAQGLDTLHKHAIAGFQGAAGMMPAKGGRTDLSDDAVKAAVDYLVAESGGPARQVPAAAAEAPPAEASAAPAEAPAAAAPTEAPPAEAAAAPADAAAAAPAAAAPEAATATADAGKGKEIYDTVCAVCHGAGIAGAPKFGDKAAWEPRIAQGADTLHQHAIQGFMGKAGMMPPKGGRADLADEDVKAAVDYMVGAAK